MYLCNIFLCSAFKKYGFIEFLKLQGDPKGIIAYGMIVLIGYLPRFFGSSSIREKKEDIKKGTEERAHGNIPMHYAARCFIIAVGLMFILQLSVITINHGKAIKKAIQQQAFFGCLLKCVLLSYKKVVERLPEIAGVSIAWIGFCFGQNVIGHKIEQEKEAAYSETDKNKEDTITKTDNEHSDIEQKDDDKNTNKRKRNGTNYYVKSYNVKAILKNTMVDNQEEINSEIYKLVDNNPEKYWNIVYRLQQERDFMRVWNNFNYYRNCKDKNFKRARDYVFYRVYSEINKSKV